LPAPGVVDPIEHERVKVDIRVERIAEARQRRCVRRARGQCSSSARRRPGGSAARRGGRAALSHGDLAEHAVHEMRRGVGHAAPAAGGAESPAFARKSHESVAAAGITASANEAMFEHSAGKVGAELTLDEAGHGMLALSCQREERLELFTDDGVEDALFRPASRVAGRARRRGSVCAGSLDRRLEGHDQWPMRGAYRPSRRGSRSPACVRLAFEDARSRHRGRAGCTRRTRANGDAWGRAVSSLARRGAWLLAGACERSRSRNLSRKLRCTAG
jgi:hypothetical protein